MQAVPACVLVLLAVEATACHLVLPHEPRDPPRPDHSLDLGDRRDRILEQPGGCSRRVLTIEGAADDGEIEGHTGDLTSSGEEVAPPKASGIFIGFWNNGPSWGYFRFRLTDAIPGSVEVTSATLDLHGLGHDLWNSSIDALRVSLEANADAPIVDDPVAAPQKAGGRPLVVVNTRDHVRWPATGGLAWKAGADHRSPELAPFLRSLLAQKGLLPVGSHLQIWVRGDREAGTAEVTTTVHERDLAMGRPLARLNLEWCPR